MRTGGCTAIIRMAEEVLAAVDEEMQQQAAALEEAEQKVAKEGPGPGGEGGSSLLWVQCVACDKWRIVSQAVYDKTVAPNLGEGKELLWYCSQNFGRLNASCSDPSDDAGA
eukprot:jgi/Botrbrau1/7851/Bobra.9_2s0027.1